MTNTKQYTLNEMWDILTTYITSEDVCQVVTDINGYNEDALNAICYAVTGYQDIAQYVESEIEEG